MIVIKLIINIHTNISLPNGTFFVGIFTYDFSFGINFTCSDKVPPQFQNFKKAINWHQLILSHLKEFDKRENEQDVSQAGTKSSLELPIWLSIISSHISMHYERLVHLSIKGLKLGKLF